jgi:anti-sigma factor RsiW
MTSMRNNELCRQRRKARGGLFASIKDKLSLQLRDHIASCPRCRQRIAKLGRVELALQMMLSQPHSLTLLQEANEAALKMLRRQERLSPKADALRQTTPQPDWTARHTKRLEKLLGVAACLMVICLIKVGVFSSLKDIHDDSQTAMHNYYARNLDPEMMGELFDEPTQQA